MCSNFNVCLHCYISGGGLSLNTRKTLDRRGQKLRQKPNQQLFLVLLTLERGQSSGNVCNTWQKTKNIQKARKKLFWLQLWNSCPWIIGFAEYLFLPGTHAYWRRVCQSSACLSAMSTLSKELFSVRRKRIVLVRKLLMALCAKCNPFIFSGFNYLLTLFSLLFIYLLTSTCIFYTAHYCIYILAWHSNYWVLQQFVVFMFTFFLYVTNTQAHFILSTVKF